MWYFTYDLFVWRAETIEMSSMHFHRERWKGSFPLSLYNEFISSQQPGDATAQYSACTLYRLKTLWKGLQMGGEEGHHPITIWISSSLLCNLLQWSLFVSLWYCRLKKSGLPGSRFTGCNSYCNFTFLFAIGLISTRQLTTSWSQLQHQHN